MHEQENIALAKQAYQCFQAGDIPKLVELLAEDVVWQLPDVDHVPFSGKRVGQHQVAQFFGDMAAAQEPLQFQPEEYIAEDDTVVVLGRYEWRVKRTGRTHGGNWAHVFTFKNGKVVNFREYTDTARVVAAYRP